jgi:hypothetical protein
LWFMNNQDKSGKLKSFSLSRHIELRRSDQTSNDATTQKDLDKCRCHDCLGGSFALSVRLHH